MLGNINDDGMLVSSHRTPYPRQDEPLLPLANILSSSVTLRCPWAPLAIRIHLEYLLYLETMLRHSLLEEWHDLRTTRVKSGYTVYPSSRDVSKEVQH